MIRVLGAMVAVVLAGCGRGVPALPGLPPGAPPPVVDAHRAAAAEPGSAAAVMRLGMAAQANGLPAFAIPCYERAAALDPDLFAARYYLGFAEAARGEMARAAVALRAALRLRAESVPVRLKLADVERELGGREESARMARELIGRDAGNATAYYLLGRATDEAAAFEKALALFPRYGAAQFALAALHRRANRLAEAARVLENYDRDKTAVPPLDDAEGAALAEMAVTGPGLLRRAQRADAAGDTAGAIALHRQAVALDSALADAWINLIALEARVGNAAGAREAYRQAAALAPGRAEGHYNFGVFCLGVRSLDEARVAFLAAVRADQRHADALVNLGSLAGERGRLDEAARYFEQAGESARARFHLGQIRMLRRDGRARATLEEARALAVKGRDAGLLAAIDGELARISR
ncbi:MAG: tetratricopeptide repeat protein [Acidobacteria bacterium]|nr:tetratricopeptide repeat protein [Acidobacteriota bacterium]